MDKVILNNGTNLEFNSISNNKNGIAIILTNKTITELETLMAKENLTKLQVANATGEVYGIYNNLECTSITKNLVNNSITVNLTKLDDTQVKISDLQKQVFKLTTQLINGGAM